MNILITGSGGLIGSEAAIYFLNKGHKVIGVDNDKRKAFFGSSVISNIDNLLEFSNYTHYHLDIRCIEKVLRDNSIDAIIHTAAQPSHDLASSMILEDYDINATATIKLLELVRVYCPDATFIYTSTNKVYGDYPNKQKYFELETRFNPLGFLKSFNEFIPIDNNLHSFFGCSKLTADIYCQEYGKNFGLNTCIFRLGCITGSRHKGAKLHGFLNYLTKCVASEKEYEIIGYEGKQVRDNLHAKDLAAAFEQVINKPVKGEVFNLGGGEHSNCSILEAIKIIESQTGKKAKTIYNPIPRVGDHIWYISDLSKFKSFYPDWKPEYQTDLIVGEVLSNL